MNDIPEFSRRIDGMRLALGGELYEIAAEPEERAGLVRRFGLLALDRLEAKVNLMPMAGGFYRLEAQFEADIVQACTVTLEPVASRIVETFTLAFGPAEDAAEIVLDGDTEPVEPLDDGVIDIGEAVAQQLSLVIDPFPRAPGVSVAGDTGVSEAKSSESPFAALARLRNPGKA